jgi:hypothetical protein
VCAGTLFNFPNIKCGAKKGTPKAAVNVISVFIYFACLEVFSMLLLNIQVTWAVTLR